MRPIWYSSSKVSMAWAGLPMSGKSSGSAWLVPPTMTRDASVAHSRALNSGKEGIFTASSVVRAGEAVKRYSFDLNAGYTFITDAKLVARQGVGDLRGP